MKLHRKTSLFMSKTTASESRTNIMTRSLKCSNACMGAMPMAAGPARVWQLSNKLLYNMGGVYGSTQKSGKAQRSISPSALMPDNSNDQSDTAQSSQDYVLVVEDSEVDFEILSRAFRRVKFMPKIHHCTDGDAAVAHLNATLDIEKKIQKPGLILLDLNLPGTDGREVLSIIKSSPGLREIPVIILSTSNNDNDIRYCFSIGAEKYLQKPISADEFTETANVIKRFWNDYVDNSGGSCN